MCKYTYAHIFECVRVYIMSNMLVSGYYMIQAIEESFFSENQEGNLNDEQGDTSL